MTLVTHDSLLREVSAGSAAADIVINTVPASVTRVIERFGGPTPRDRRRFPARVRDAIRRANDRRQRAAAILVDADRR